MEYIAHSCVVCTVCIMYCVSNSYVKLSDITNASNYWVVATVRTVCSAPFSMLHTAKMILNAKIICRESKIDNFQNSCSHKHSRLASVVTEQLLGPILLYYAQSISLCGFYKSVYPVWMSDLAQRKG